MPLRSPQHNGNNNFSNPLNNYNQLGHPQMFNVGNQGGYPQMMSMPLPNFDPSMGPGDYQKYILMIINYYETHLNNMKNIITNQHENFHTEKQRFKVFQHSDLFHLIIS